MYNGFLTGYPYMNFQPQPPPQQQGMSQPMIQTTIIQVGSDEEAWNHAVASGSSQMMMARDDSAIYVKTASPNGQTSMEIYRREAPKPRPAPGDYVTKEELAAALEAIREAKEAEK